MQSRCAPQSQPGSEARLPGGYTYRESGLGKDAAFAVGASPLIIRPIFRASPWRCYLLKTTLGDFELMHVTDGTFLLDGGAVFGVVPKLIWQRKYPPDQNNLLPFALNSLVVRSDDRTILIESGAGPKLPQQISDLYQTRPCLLQNLANLGLAADDIDVVINTHLHFDHCGWNTYYKDGKPQPTFPRAKYYVQEGELQHAHEQHERDRVSYMTDNYDPLVNSGQMQLLRGDAEIASGISVEVYSGHTRDLQAVILRSGRHAACYPSDLVCDTNHLEPMWVLGYDLYPLQTIDNKHRFYDVAIPENWLLVFTHDDKTPWAYLERGDKGLPVARAAEEKVG